ncbi:MAG: hypothetical protein ACSLFI_10295 [Solirubrobacterales bacterium]
MTDRSRAVKRRKPSPVAVFLASAALFLGSLGFLSYQLAQGKDPALGTSVASVEKPKRPVVTVRRIIKRRVITTVVPAPAATSIPVSSGSAPSSSYSAPAPVAVAPAPAPVTASS